MVRGIVALRPRARESVKIDPSMGDQDRPLMRLCPGSFTRSRGSLHPGGRADVVRFSVRIERSEDEPLYIERPIREALMLV